MPSSNPLYQEQPSGILRTTNYSASVSTSKGTLMSSSSSSPNTPLSSYTCDTLPVPQNLRSHRQSRSPSPFPSLPLIETTHVSTFDVLSVEEVHASDSDLLIDAAHADVELEQAATPEPPGRKLCVRHRRMADGGTNLMLQKALDALPMDEREAVNKIWSGFSSSSHSTRAVILKGVLTMCCFSQLSMLSDQLKDISRVDPFLALPREIGLKILGYMDAISLCRAAQVSKLWSTLADDDTLWRNICEQHIGQKCHKCGWGLPMLERRRRGGPQSSPTPEEAPSSLLSKRCLQDDSVLQVRPMKRQKSCSSDNVASEFLGALSLRAPPSSHSTPNASSPPISSIPTRPVTPSPSNAFTRPWKDVYCERLRIERNWRRGRCTVRTLKGHTDGVMCLQFSETLQHPSFPVLITGSYDRTVRVWNLETGTEMTCLRGHSRAVRALQFDEAKLITGSMDHTIRVWNWRTGRCIRTLDGHTDGVVCLNYDSKILASGGVDMTVKIWNFRTGECFTLRGHRDWVNAVQLWDSQSPDCDNDSCSTSMLENPKVSEDGPSTHIDPGKMLFSASDDGSIRLWDLTTRCCVREFLGHVGQVQSMKLLLVDSCEDSPSPMQSAIHANEPHPNLRSEPADDNPLDISAAEFSADSLNFVPPPSGHSDVPHPLAKMSSTRRSLLKGPMPVLVTGSLDNTIRVWDVESGKPIQTLFGHIEGVWAVAGDKLRLVSGSHDRTIKVWVREEGQCMKTLVGHLGAVTCLALGDDKIVSGSDDGDVRVWNFAEID